MIEAKGGTLKRQSCIRTIWTYTSLESHLSTFDGLPTRVKLDMLTKSRGLLIGLHSFINELKHTRFR